MIGFEKKKYIKIDVITWYIDACTSVCTSVCGAVLVSKTVYVIV